MARSAAEQREYNRNKQREYRAKQKAKRTAGAVNTPDDVVSDSGVPIASSGAGTSDDLEIEVREEEQPVVAPLSFKDRVLLKFTGQSAEPAAAPVKRGRRKKKGDNLFVTTIPTVVAAFVATYSQNLLPEEYAPCAPTQEEVSGIIGPLFEILGRRVEVVGQASEDTLAVINSIIGGFMYGIRAYITYADIKREADHERQQTSLRATGNHTGSNDPGERERERDYPGTIEGYPPTRFSHPGGAKNAYSAENDAEWSGAGSHDVSGQREPSEAEKVANLFKRDKQGRVELGLLPRAV